MKREYDLDLKNWEVVHLPPGGCHIEVACEVAAREAARTQEEFVFEFNGTRLCAQPGDSADWLVREYRDKREDRQVRR